MKIKKYFKEYFFWLGLFAITFLMAFLEKRVRVLYILSIVFLVIGLAAWISTDYVNYYKKKRRNLK